MKDDLVGPSEDKKTLLSGIPCKITEYLAPSSIEYQAFKSHSADTNGKGYEGAIDPEFVEMAAGRKR
jgi:hypothetical protein